MYMLIIYIWVANQFRLITYIFKATMLLQIWYCCPWYSFMWQNKHIFCKNISLTNDNIKEQCTTWLVSHSFFILGSKNVMLNNVNYLSPLWNELLVPNLLQNHRHECTTIIFPDTDWVKVDWHGLYLLF